jgi:hypothetical protein
VFEPPPAQVQAALDDLLLMEKLKLEKVIGCAPPVSARIIFEKMLGDA